MESIRLQTLNRQALQQVQVDVHHLRPQLRRCGLQSLILLSPSAGVEHVL